MYIKHPVIGYCKVCNKNIYKINHWGGGFEIKYTCRCSSKDKIHPALRINKLCDKQ